ncbi:MAG: chemotaxis protein CheD [Oligoflexia bacterium]|nr:chemotaxis protein CheD [Oligoflexia bacterium]
MKISEDPNEVLVAPNLGSCLGVSVYDPKRRLAGLIHCLLPLSKSDPQKAQQNPYMYVDTGMAAMLDQMVSRGADPKHLIISVGGGANINDENNVFEIGKKNLTVLKKFLWKNNLLLKAEHVGESVSRTVSLHVGSGKTLVKTQGQTIELS